MGGTQIFGRTGMCRSNGSLFHKKSLNMGPVFYQKILKHGSTFLTEPKFLGFRLAKTLKIAKFLKNGPIFQEKSLKMGTFFCQNHPYRWVGVLRLERHTSVQPPGQETCLNKYIRVVNKWSYTEYKSSEKFPQLFTLYVLFPKGTL